MEQDFSFGASDSDFRVRMWTTGACVPGDETKLDAYVKWTPPQTLNPTILFCAALGGRDLLPYMSGVDQCSKARGAAYHIPNE